MRSRARNLRANERREDGCQPREMFKISEQLYFCCVAVAGERGREKGELGVSEARGSQSAMPLLGAVAVFWGSLRGLGCIAGAVGGVEVVVGGEGEVLSTGPGRCCVYLHAAMSTGAADLLSGRRSAYLRRMGWGAPEFAERMIERPWVRERQLQWILLRMMVRRYRVLCRSGEAGTSSRTSQPGISS